MKKSSCCDLMSENPKPNQIIAEDNYDGILKQVYHFLELLPEALESLFSADHIRNAEIARQAIQPLVEILNTGLERE